MTPSIDSALIIRFSSVGDILLTTTLVRTFRHRFRDCRLDYLIQDKYGELVRHNPHLSNVISFPRGGTTRDLIPFGRELFNTRYDLIIDVHNSMRSRFLCAGQKQVVRIKKRKTARLLLIKTKKNFYGSLGGSPSVAERYIEPVESLGVMNDGKGLEFPVPEVAMKYAVDRVGQISRPMIGVAPGSTHYTKQWHPERFAEVACQLAKEHEAGVILFGNSKERPQCELIERMLTRENISPVFNTAGETTLTQVGALMDHCSVVITNDSGLMHLASARKRKVVAIFGCTVEQFGFFPYGTESVVVEPGPLSCRPCSHIGRADCPQGHFRCMNDITPDMVIRAARSLTG